MKAKHFLALCCVSVALLVGCKKEYITEEHITEEHITEQYLNYGSQVKTYSYEVGANDWQLSESAQGSYLYATFENADLDEEVMENGAVLAYIYFVYNAENGAGSWNMLPYVYPYGYLVENSFETKYVTENIRMEYELGYVTFIREDMDGVAPEGTANTYSIKLCIIKNAND